MKMNIFLWKTEIAGGGSYQQYPGYSAGIPINSIELSRFQRSMEHSAILQNEFSLSVENEVRFRHTSDVIDEHMTLPSFRLVLPKFGMNIPYFGNLLRNHLQKIAYTCTILSVSCSTDIADIKLFERLVISTLRPHLVIVITVGITRTF